MTKTTIELINKLTNNKEYENTDLYKYYQKCIHATDLEESISLLHQIDEFLFDINFLNEYKNLLEVTRNSVYELLNDLCLILKEKILEITKEPVVIDEPNNLRVYCSINDRNYIMNKLLYTNYSKCILAEEPKILDEEWYKLYVYQLD